LAKRGEKKRGRREGRKRKREEEGHGKDAAEVVVSGASG
jgi:hypothetical protein